jgi:hypothetical protein
MCCEHAKPYRLTEGEMRRLYALRQQREAEARLALGNDYIDKLMEALLLQANARWNTTTLKWVPDTETMVVEQPTKVEAPVARELVFA